MECYQSASRYTVPFVEHGLASETKQLPSKSFAESVTSTSISPLTLLSLPNRSLENLKTTFVLVSAAKEGA